MGLFSRNLPDGFTFTEHEIRGKVEYKLYYKGIYMEYCTYDYKKLVNRAHDIKRMKKLP